jgi:hypothetical protein
MSKVVYRGVEYDTEKRIAYQQQRTKTKRRTSLSGTTSTTSWSKIMIQSILSITAGIALTTMFLSLYIQWIYR